MFNCESQLKSGLFQAFFDEDEKKEKAQEKFQTRKHHKSGLIGERGGLGMRGVDEIAAGRLLKYVFVMETLLKLRLLGFR